MGRSVHGAYRIALDINTSAVSVVTYKLERIDKKLAPTDIMHMDLRVFGEPVVDGELKKSTRRRIRGARRLRQRYKQRLKKISYLFPLLGESSESVAREQGDNVHEWRAKGISERIEVAQLLAVFMSMAKNRGYAGILSKEDGEIKKRIEDTEILMRENSCSTLGELLYLQKQNSTKGAVVKSWKKISEQGTYANRDWIKEEFEKLWTEQEKHHTILNLNDNSIQSVYEKYFCSGDVKSIEKRKEQDVSVKDLYYMAMFDQRPVWWDTSTIGICVLEKEHIRAPKAHPVFQSYRIEKQLNDLQLYQEKRTLTQKEKDKLRIFLQKQKVLPASKAYKLLAISGDRFTHDRGRHTHKEFALLGDASKKRIDALQKKTGVQLSEKAQHLFVELLADVDNPVLFSHNEWHLQENIVAYLERCELQEQGQLITFVNALAELDILDYLNGMGLEKGRASYSVKAMKKMLPLMRNGMREDEARESIYGKHIGTDSMKYVGDGVVQQALKETKKAIEYAIKKHGGIVPTQFVIELSRDMKKSQKSRNFIEKRNIKKEQAKQKVIELLGNTYPTDNNIKRYLLFVQQNSKCIYCGDELSKRTVFSRNAVIDHIVPKNYGGENNLSNLALVHENCSQEKAMRLPLEAFSGTPKEQAIKKCHQEMKSGAFLKKPFDVYRQETCDRMERLLIEDGSFFEKGFNLRQNTETAWIGKELTMFLKQQYNLAGEDRVYVSRGALTSYLRTQLGLDTLLADIRKEEGKIVLNKKGEIMEAGDENSCASWHEKKKKFDEQFDKRSDHRHHLIDAAIIGLVDRSLFKKATEHYQNPKNYKKTKRGWVPTLQGFAQEHLLLHANIRDILKQRLQYYVVWYKQDHYPSGKFFDDFVYGCEFDTKKLVITKSLLSMVQGNILTFEKVKEKLEFIIGDTVRSHVIKEFERRYQNCTKKIGEKRRIIHALCGEHEEDGIFFPVGTNNKIKKVKCYHKISRGIGRYNELFDKPKVVYKDMSGQQEDIIPHYILNNNSYACVEFLKNENGVYHAMEFIPLHKFWAHDYQQRKQQDGIERLYRDDIVYIVDEKTKKGDFLVVKQIHASTGLIRCMSTTEASAYNIGNKHGLYKTIGKSHLRHIMLIKDRKEIGNILRLNTKE